MVDSNIKGALYPFIYCIINFSSRIQFTIDHNSYHKSEVIYEMFHILNCGHEIFHIKFRSSIYETFHISLDIHSSRAH